MINDIHTRHKLKRQARRSDEAFIKKLADEVVGKVTEMTAQRDAERFKDFCRYFAQFNLHGRSFRQVF